MVTGIGTVRIQSLAIIPIDKVPSAFPIRNTMATTLDLPSLTDWDDSCNHQTARNQAMDPIQRHHRRPPCPAAEGNTHIAEHRKAIKVQGHINRCNHQLLHPSCYWPPTTKELTKFRNIHFMNSSVLRQIRDSFWKKLPPPSSLGNAKAEGSNHLRFQMLPRDRIFKSQKVKNLFFW